MEIKLKIESHLPDYVLIKGLKDQLRIWKKYKAISGFSLCSKIKEKPMKLTKSFEEDFYILGFHTSLEEAKKLWDKFKKDTICYEYYDVVQVEHVWVRHGFLIDGLNEYKGERGWWVVEKPTRGAGRATRLVIRYKKESK